MLAPAPAAHRAGHGLPASKEVLLEIQVNKLIHKFLFTSPALECHKPTPASKEKTHILVSPLPSPCAAGFPTLSPASKENTHILVSPLPPPCAAGFPALSPAPSFSSASRAATGAGVSPFGAHLSRTQTFPSCSTESAEVKHSCRKPPRPPPSPSETLAGCTSDTSLLLQTKRPRAERKRRALPARAPANASMWALVFTLCFAVGILAQGFWSQSNRGVPVEANAGAGSSPATNVVRTSAPSSSAGGSEGKLKEATVYASSSNAHAGKHRKTYTRSSSSSSITGHTRGPHFLKGRKRL